MPMSPVNQRTFHRTLFAGWSGTVTLFKRNDNQQQGTVTTYTLFNCRRSMIFKTGETIQGDMSADHRTTWHIPRIELDRIGIAYLNAADRIRQDFGNEKGSYWMPDAETRISVKLGSVEIDLDCTRVDPPRSGG